MNSLFLPPSFTWLGHSSPEVGGVSYGVHVTNQEMEALSSSQFPESWLMNRMVHQSNWG